MKIGVFAYPHYRTPPEKYGPIQTVTYGLIRELAKRGHKVTAFASGDSDIPCKKISVKETPDMDDHTVPDAKIYEQASLQELLKYRESFDVLSSHVSFHILPLLELLNYPVAVNLQGTYTNPHYKKVFYYYKEANFVSISNKQREQLPDLNYVATVYHGIELDKFSFNLRPKEQLGFLGRTNPLKGLDVAIKVAKETNQKLIIGAREDKDELSRKFFAEKIEPQIDNKSIVWLGERDAKEKVELLKNSKALIFPINWEEAFGLVMIEAMACGTPVIGFRRGSVPEVVVEGKTGFICPAGNIGAMRKAVEKIFEMTDEEYQEMRKNCRRHVEENFTVEKMVDGYERVYQQLVKDWKKKNGK